MDSGRTLPANDQEGIHSQPQVAGPPITPAQLEAIQAQLEKLLASHFFSQSRRYPALLRFMVQAAVAGQGEMLRERVIGHMVFERPAGYDTNADPVVRITAAEVRKRIAQYYHQEGHADEVRIELRAGTYVPEFLFPEEETAEESSIKFDPPAEQAPEATFAPPVDGEDKASPSLFKQRRQLLWVIGIAASALLGMAIALVARLTRVPALVQHATPALNRIWQPLLVNSRSILICLGESNMNAGKSVPVEVAGNEPDDDSMLQAYVDKRDFVPFPDVQAFSRFAQLLGSQGHDFSVQTSSKTVYYQLRETPVLLLGAFNNHWTIDRTAKLRFTFVTPSGSIQRYLIKDARNPNQDSWQVDASLPRSEINRDYAIIARFEDEEIGQTVMVAAGLSGGGSRAAAEFLTNEEDLKDLLSRAPSGWNRNFEAVISSEVVRGMQGKPKIVAVEFW